MSDTDRRRASVQLWRCKGCGQVITSASHLVPLKHSAKNPDGCTSSWCEAGYELVEPEAS